MTRAALLLLASPILILGACRAQPESVANRYERTSGEIENMARVLDSETENQVRAIEAETQNQIDAIAANQANAMTEAPNTAPPTQSGAGAVQEPRRAGQPAPDRRQD